MKTINKIIAILGIALIATVSIGAVNATDDYFIHDGTSDTSCVSQHTYEKGILTIPISNNVVDSGSVSDVIGAWDYTPAPIPSLPDVHADGNELMVGYFHNGDFPKSFNVDDWNGYTAGEWTPEHTEPTIECDGVPNVCPSPIDGPTYFNK